MSHNDLIGHIKNFIIMSNNNESKQAMWEMWFVASVIIFLATIFVGTTVNKYEYPNFDIWLGVVIANIIICIMIGSRKY